MEPEWLRDQTLSLGLTSLPWLKIGSEVDMEVTRWWNKLVFVRHESLGVGILSGGLLCWV